MPGIFNTFALLVAAIAIIVSYVSVDRKAFGTATALFVASMVLISIVFKDAVDDHLNITNAVVIGLSYIICGLMVAFAFWISYISHAKTRFDYHFQNQLKLSEAAHKHVAIDESFRDDFIKSHAQYCSLYSRVNLHDIFSDNDYDLSIYLDSASTYYGNERLDQETVTSLKKQYDDAVNKVIPPRFAVCKPFVFGAAAVWPVTAAWLILNRILKNAMMRIISAFSEVFNSISRKIFGNF